MARLKCTKIELVRLRKKLVLFRKYLPTLQLKKMLLQAEVNKAREEVRKLQEIYVVAKKDALDHSHLWNDPAIHELTNAFEVKEILLKTENIAGISVPVLEKLVFNDPDLSLLKTPLWVDDAIVIIRKLKHTYQKVITAEEKKAILESELRTISIRVNLFEKRLIPELESDIKKIRVFLGDQELQAVGQAKVSKEKIIKRKLAEEEMVS